MASQAVDLTRRRRAEDDLVSEVSDLFSEAEKEIKAVQYGSDFITTPPVNELRYAGYHILKSLSAETLEKKKEEMQKARNHCRRALYDAIEIRVLDILRSIALFQHEYRLIPIVPVIPDYNDDRRKIIEARDQLENIKNNNHGNREEYCEQCRQSFLVLKTIHEKFEAAREELNKTVRESRRSMWFNRTMLLFVIATFIVATIAIL